jgi:hypothetical protein
MTITWFDILSESPCVTAEEIQKAETWADVQKLLNTHYTQARAATISLSPKLYEQLEEATAISNATSMGNTKA